MPLRKPLAAALLLLAAAALPQLFGLGVHALRHHGHGKGATGYGAEWSHLARAVVHGHEHGEEIPDHEHHLLPSPPLRLDVLRDLQVPSSFAFLEAPDTGHRLLSGVHPLREKKGLSGPSPPILHLVCTLLI